MILDIMGAAYLGRNVTALAVNGRLVVIGLQGGRKAELDLSALLAKLSGDAFFDRLDSRDRISDAYYPRLEEHQELGTYTMYATIGLGVLALALGSIPFLAKLVADAVKMREDIARHKPPSGPLDVKLGKGGLVDLEFLTQFLQIVHAAQQPDVLDQNTEMALTKLSAAGVLAAGDAEIAAKADLVRVLEAEHDKLTFKYTGPWPPYNFVNIRLKLERAGQH